jgi:hypothetical protein
MGNQSEIQPNVNAKAAPEKFSLRNVLIGLAVGTILYVIASLISPSSRWNVGWFLGAIVGTWRRPNHLPLITVLGLALKWGIYGGVIWFVFDMLLAWSTTVRAHVVGILILWAGLGAGVGALAFGNIQAERDLGKYYHSWSEFRTSFERSLQSRRQQLLIAIVCGSIVAVVYAVLMIYL